MIINSFDMNSDSKINPKYKEDRLECNACIITFSNIIEEYVISKYKPELIGSLKCVTGEVPVYKINYNNKIFAFYKTYMGGPAAVGLLEDVTEIIDTKNYVVFGGAGTLNKEISHGKVMIPTEAYRDEGTSYHYVQPSDYIKMNNHYVVADFMNKNEIPYIEGKTWTTDAFFRETLNNFNLRKNDGCISVEMECASLQSVCTFRGLELYYFLTSGDLLDAPVWDRRKEENQIEGTQHDNTHFEIALLLADYIE